MKGYSSGMRKDRVDILNRKPRKVGKFGIDSAGVEYERAASVWASVTWAKGLRAMNAGAVDAYSVVLVRMNYNKIVTARSRIGYDGDIYQVLPETFHADKGENTIQFSAQIIIDEE